MRINIKSRCYFLLLLLGLSGSGLANHAIKKKPLNLSKDTFEAKNPKLSLQLGGVISSQGTNQFIAIDGTLGDYFSISHQNNYMGLLGIGYYPVAKETSFAIFKYGLNAFYLARTQIKGMVTQEQLFTNLSYNYSITNWPIYIAAKALIKNTNTNRQNITLDVGIGPNIIQTTHFNEQPLQVGIIPDTIFAGQTNTVFTAMAGIGYRIEDVFGSIPVECGYRFFYLGQTHLRNINTQILNHFTTGQSYANALLCAISI